MPVPKSRDARQEILLLHNRMACSGGTTGLLQLSVYLAMIDGRNEQDKFEQLYEAYQGLILHTAKQLLPDRQFAEEAASMTFEYAARNIRKVGAVDSSRTQAYLISILKSVAVDLARKQGIEARHRADWTELEQMEAKEKTDEIADAVLDQALEHLPEPYQQVILLKYAQGYNTREIAAMLNYTVSKVEKLLSRGKQKLRRALEEVERQ